MQLSSDQLQAVTDISDFLSSDRREQVLTGGPGTGKSFLTAKIIEKAEEIGLNVILAATTNPAVEVLSDFTGTDVITVHKLLDLKVKQNYVTGKTTIEQIVTAKGPKLFQMLRRNIPTLIIMDEASYIDNEIHGYIQAALEEYSNIIILYVGDKFQLPPVDSEEPHIFHINLTMNRLTTDHRFPSDSQMAEIVTALRDNIENKSYLLVPIETGTDVTVLSPKHFLAKMEELYKSEEYVHDPYFVKSLAYRNKTVDNMNKHIRSYYYSDDSYQEGERLIVTSPLIRNGKALANNGEILTVIRSEPTEVLDVKGTEILFRNSKGNRFKAVICEQPRKKTMIRKKLVADGEWKKLYPFMERFIFTKPMYASTIHKAQGASYKNVLLNLEDLVECQDHTLLARLLLVAVSRASEHVYVYGKVPPHLLRSN